MSRRASLGPVSQSTLNKMDSGATRFSMGVSARASMGAGLKSKSMILPGEGKRMSTGISRKSTAFEAPASRTDPRPIKDKAFTSYCIRTLLEYLTSNNYDYAISPKVLSKPSGKDFNNIVLFLFRQIDHTYALTGKFEDEVIAMFKQLKYTVPISKTALTSVGAPVTWPPLLASLVWLIELLQYDDATAKEFQHELLLLEEDNEQAHQLQGYAEKSFCRYLCSGYNLFLHGDDESYAVLEQEYIGSSNKSIQALVDQLQCLEDENKSVGDELRAIDEKRSLIPVLEQKKKDYEDDLQKFEMLINQLVEHRDKHRENCGTRQEELHNLNDSISQVEADIVQLKERIATQELSADDVQRLTADRDRIHTAWQHSSDQKAELLNKVHHCEDTLRGKVVGLENKVKKYGDLLSNLKIQSLTPADKQALVIDVNIHAKKKTEIMKSDIKGNVLPVLQQYRNTIQESLTTIQRKLLDAQDEVENGDQNILEEKSSVTEQESKIQRIEELYKREKEACEKTVHSRATEMESLESQVFGCRDVSKEEVSISSNGRLVLELDRMKEEQANKHKIFVKEMHEQMTSVLSACVSQRSLIRERLHSLKLTHETRLEELLQRMATSSDASD